MKTNYIVLPNGDFLREDELMHYGVKGMKWGVRKDRNLSKAHDEYQKNRTLIRKYVTVTKNGGAKAVGSKEASEIRKRIQESDRLLKQHVSNYLKSVGKKRANELVKFDYEHGRHYVDAQLFDVSIKYDDRVYID